MPIELRIIMDENGQINVSGPIDNKVLAYGLLECAKDAIFQAQQQSQNRIQPAAFMPVPPKGVQ